MTHMHPIIMIGAMADKIVPFPQTPTVEFLLERARLALADGTIEFDHPHMQEQLKRRNLTMRHVLECIRYGDVIDGPKPDKYSDWRIKLRRYVAGRKVQVTVAVKLRRTVVVTVI